jgi:uncharacterized protein
MKRDEIISVLQAHEADLRVRGVRHVALFGSVARDAAKPGSDIDILIELEPDAPIGMFEYTEIVQYLSDLFSDRVDVANGNKLKPIVKPSAEQNAIFAF